MGVQQDISVYEERSSSLIDESPQMDEQNTRRKIIEPLIEILGWDILSSDVELEYSVRMGAGTKKVDYALILEDTPVVFVEAKGCDTTITEDHTDQLTSYMRQVGVELGMISNGRQFEIFRRDLSSTRPKENSLGKFSLEQIEQNVNLLKALSKESIEKGEHQQIADKIESVQKARRQLQQNKEEIAESVTRVVTEKIGESVSQQVEDEAKNFVDELVESLGSQSQELDKRSPPPEPEAQSEGKYLVVIQNDGSTMVRISGPTQAEAMGNVADYLIEEHGLLDEIELPYQPGTKRGHTALINDEPVHTGGDEMRAYQELVGGLYLFTSLNARSKTRYISELVEKVGMDCEFSESWGM